jgi:hypothetical protein
MPANRPVSPIAHIYAPRFPNDPVEIVGNKPGLERLINVLIDAIGTNGAKDTIYTSDGHQSEVRATCLPGKRRPEEWRRSGSPYWDVDDPLIAKIVDLTDENRRLRWVVSALRHLSKSITQVDSRGAAEASSDPSVSPGD